MIKSTRRKNLFSNKIQLKIEQIQRDNISGAVELAKQAAETFKLLLDSKMFSSTSRPTKLFEILAHALVDAQPTMAPIFNLANRILLNINSLNTKREIKQVVHTICQRFLYNLAMTNQKISKYASEIILDNTIIITHSYSSTLLDTLIYLKKTGKSMDIICTESRPINEGLFFAQQLAKENIAVKLIVDAAVFTFISTTDLILVGADALTHAGLINKIGTRGLAFAAYLEEKDIYVLCNVEKILPKDAPIILNMDKNPKEIVNRPLDNITPINYYFDLTPLKYLTGIITEKGILTNTELNTYINKLPLHNSFM